MKLKKGQRWLYVTTNLLVEVLDASTCRCRILMLDGSFSLAGEEHYYSFALGRAIKGESNGFVYLQGQDAPE